MMAEMIAAYPSQGKSPGATAAPVPAASAAAADSPSAAPAANGSGYLNEVSALSARRVDLSGPGR